MGPVACTLLFGCISPLEWGQNEMLILQHFKVYLLPGMLFLEEMGMEGNGCTQGLCIIRVFNILPFPHASSLPPSE